MYQQTWLQFNGGHGVYQQRHSAVVIQQLSASTADGTVLLGPDLQNIVRQSYERLTKSDVHLQNILRRMQSFS